MCADGIGSGFRSRLIPEATRQYAGYVAWRGMVPEAELEPADAAALGDAITYHVFANSHILVYPIPGLDGSVEPGSRLINYVWYRNYLAGDDLDDVLTDADGERRELSLPPGTARAEHIAEVRATAEGPAPAPHRRRGRGRRATVPAGDLRRGGAAHGVRSDLPHRRRGLGGSPARRGRHRQGRGRRVGTRRRAHAQ